MEKLGKKLKHDHTLTSILKFTIFAMVMLAPIFSVASRCLYVICNKNAKDSYSNQLIEQTQSINNGSSIMDGDIITFNYVPNNITGTTSTDSFTFYELSFNPTDYGFNDLPYNKIAIDTRLNANFVFLYVDDNYYFKDIWGTQLKSITIKAKGQQGGATTTQTTVCYKTTYTTQKLDNAFEYSLSQLQESNYYNWATNLGIYTPIHNMVHGLGGHDIIALLLAYWSIYTAIYIVFDIIIVCFVKITHMIQGE